MRDWNVQAELDELRQQGLWRELRVPDGHLIKFVQRLSRALWL